MIQHDICHKVLVIGPDYENHRGGIGAVIGSHRKFYYPFNFIPTFKPLKNNIAKALYFTGQLGKIVYYLFKNKQIKIVHIHSSKQGSFYRKLAIACIAKYIFRKKTINHIHSGNFKRFYDNNSRVGKGIIRFFLKMNDTTITVSDSWKVYYINSFGLKNIYKLNNIVDKQQELPEQDPIETNQPINLLFLGLIDSKKGIFDLIKVLAENKTLLTGKVKLLIGGNGQVESLQRQIKENMLEEMVEYKGWVTGEKKDCLLKTADVFILPSYFEGAPVSILEAMAFGKPIISTHVGGIPEMVHMGENGLLFTPGDKKTLAEAIFTYVNHPEIISLHGSGSLKKVSEFYPETVMPQLESIYKQLLFY